MKLPEWWMSDKPYMIIDWVDGLRSLPDGVIDCVVTSPPYFNLRDYGVDGQVGLEDTFDDYINIMCNGFDEVKRVLKNTGTVWVNLGDSYSGGGGRGSGEYVERHTQFGKEVDPASQSLPLKTSLPDKSLIMIPFRFAIEMVNRGWILRNTIIWHKRNCMPSSVKDRFTVDYEYMFFFTKSKKYYFEQQFEEFSESYKNEKRPPGVLRQRLYEGSKYRQFDYGNDQFKGEPTIEPDERFRKQDNVPSKNANTYKGFNERWKKSKYADKAVEATNRQGMHKKRGDGQIEKRNVPSPRELLEYLKQWKGKYSYKELDELLGKIGDCTSHWFTYPESKHGFSYPSKEDWIKLKEILEFDDTYDKQMTETWFEFDGIETSQQGRNKRCVWTINPKPYGEAHFACYPPELIETPIKAGCPKEVCNKCGKPREKIYGTPQDGRPTRDKDAKYCSLQPEMSAGQQYQKWRVENPPEFKGYSNCGCNAGFSPGIVLDPFLGSGTTLYVARMNQRLGLGFELNPDYEKMIKKRGMANISSLEDFDLNQRNSTNEGA